MHSMEYPAKLAFSPDDSSLVGCEATCALWPLPVDTRPVEELRTQTQGLNSRPPVGGEHLLQVPSTQERVALRGTDPGPPIADAATPIPRVARYIDGFPVLARDPAASPLLLDLTEAYTRAPEAVDDYTSVKAGDIGVRGIVRLDGVDYDARGAVETRRTGRRSDARTPTRFKGIRVPPTPIAAFHVLMYASQAIPTSEVRDYAYLRVHYTDGASALLRIRTQREVWGSTSHDAPTPVGWVTGRILVLLGSSKLELYNNPRLPNPHPEKLIATIDLEAADEGFSEPMFYAVTAEPVIAAADNGNEKADDSATKAAADPSHPP